MPDQIYRDAKNFGWDLPKLEKEGKFKLICTTPNLLLEEDGAEIILGEPIKEINAKRIVIDSITHLEMFIPPIDMRKEAYRLLRFLKVKGLSSMCLWESTQTIGLSIAVTEFGISFLVDCIILLNTVEIESTMRKALVIMKMRGSNHDKRLREFEITSNGINVLAPFRDYEGVITGTPRKSVTDELAKAWISNFGKK